MKHEIEFLDMAEAAKILCVTAHVMAHKNNRFRGIKLSRMMRGGRVFFFKNEIDYASSAVNERPQLLPILMPMNEAADLLGIPISVLREHLSHRVNQKRSEKPELSSLSSVLSFCREPARKGDLCFLRHEVDQLLEKMTAPKKEKKILTQRAGGTKTLSDLLDAVLPICNRAEGDASLHNKILIENMCVVIAKLATELP